MKDYNEVLYNKMKKEFDDLIAEIKTMPAEKIIEFSYEKVLKEDILSIFEYTDFKQEEAKALYVLDNTLDVLYQDWMHTDLSYMDMLRDIVDERIKKEVCK